MRRCARLIQPTPGPDSPASPSIAPSHPAQRAACRDSPSSRWARWARPMIRAKSSSRPVRWADQASSQRSAAARGSIIGSGQGVEGVAPPAPVGSSRGRVVVAPRQAARLGPSCPPRPRRRLVWLVCASTDPIFSVSTLGGKVCLRPGCLKSSIAQPGRSISTWRAPIGMDGSLS
jgi:hypothetical protein